MNKFFLCLLCGALISAGPIRAAAAGASPAWVSLKVNQTVAPQYPLDLILNATKQGTARVAFSVDPTGKLEDYLIVAYSNRSYAEALVRALKQWTFEPARWRGEPVGVTSEVSAEFELEGLVIVSMSQDEISAIHVRELAEKTSGYRQKTLNELDRIPTPISAPAPNYPSLLVKQGRRGIVPVEFYIDEQGAVRLPSVPSSADQVLASLAIEALKRWKFEPPTCEGVAVLAKARQAFYFGVEKTRPSADAATGEK